MRLAQRLVGQVGITSLEYRDERAARCVTGQVCGERYHLAEDGVRTPRHFAAWLASHGLRNT